ncbi:MAG: hypothetical protein ACFB4I_01590 [Cyanophyceae cyanobacterium]
MKQLRPNRNQAQVLAAVFGVLTGLPAMMQEAKAQSPAPALAQCPGIYYEEPFNSIALVPEGCPPNAYTGQQGQAPVAPLPGTVDESVAPLPGDADIPASAPPLPEERSDPVAMIMPVDGQVSVTIKNNTNAIITYEAVGHTERRYLQGGEETMLTDLPLPLTLTMVRQDDGFIEVKPLASDSGMLEVTLDEEAQPLDDNQGVLRIQEDGQVFLN